MRNTYHLHPYLLAVCIGAVALLAAALQIRPTFDDFTTLSSPNYDPDVLHYLLPMGSTWRPSDSIMGYINAIDYHLFPTLSHIEIWAAHLGSTLLVYVICRQLHIGLLPRSIATAFFFFSPCTLATTLSCDGTNQSTCHLLGLMAVWAYLRYDGRRKYLLWMLLVVLSSFSKDNGIAWAVVPPVIAWAFGRIDRRTFMRHFAYGIALAIIYGIVRLSLPNNNPLNEEYEQQFTSLFSRISGIGKWLGYTWTATDFLSVFHQPNRNLAWAAVTLVLSVPFFLLLFLRRNIWRQRTFYGIIAAIVITESPNLLIAMSLMNAYASLGMAALLVGWLTQQYLNNPKECLDRDGSGSSNNAVSVKSHRHVMLLQLTFTIYLVVAVLVDIHHWYWAWKTSLPGMELAQQAVEKTRGSVDKAYCIVIRDDYPKYSSFCVPTDEAFGWGRSVWQVTGYTWPRTLKDTVLERSANAMQQARVLARKKRQQGYDCVWIVNKHNVDVIQ